MRTPRPRRSRVVSHPTKPWSERKAELFATVREPWRRALLEAHRGDGVHFEMLLRDTAQALEDAQEGGGPLVTLLDPDGSEHTVPMRYAKDLGRLGWRAKIQEKATHYEFATLLDEAGKEHAVPSQFVEGMLRRGWQRKKG